MAALQTRGQSEQQDALGETLALVAGRVRNQRWIRGGVRGLVAALVLDILLAALSRADVLPGVSSVSLLLVVLPVAVTNLGGYFATRHPITPMDAARLAEARLPLKERLSSALEFDGVPRSNPLLALQHADAESHARTLDARLAAPVRAPREAWLVPVLLLVLAAALWLPNLPFALTPAQRAERETVQQAGRQLAQAAHQAAEQADARHEPEAKRQAQKMEALGKRMAQGHMDRAQALAAVSKQEQELGASSPSVPSAPADAAHAAKDIAGPAQSPTPPTRQTAASPKGASAPASSSGSPANAPGQAGPQASSETPKQTGRNAAPQASGRPPARPAGQHTGANAPNRTRTPNTDNSSQGTNGTHPPSSPASAADKTGQAADVTSRQRQSVPSSQGMPAARQALENARRQLAASGASSQSPAGKGNTPKSPPSASAPPGSPPRPGSAGKSARPSAAPSGKPNGQSSGSRDKLNAQGSGSNSKPKGEGKSSGNQPGGQSQSNGGKPNAASSPAGKGRAGQPGQSKTSSQSLSNPGVASGQPAPGGAAGRAAKAPFRAVLPPTTPSKSQGIYLGTPSRGGEQNAAGRKQSSRPSAPAPSSRVPYGPALPRYRKSAEAALDQEQVPPSQRAVVRDYFNSLPPAK